MRGQGDLHVAARRHDVGQQVFDELRRVERADIVSRGCARTRFVRVRRGRAYAIYIAKRRPVDDEHRQARRFEMRQRFVRHRAGEGAIDDRAARAISDHPTGGVVKRLEHRTPSRSLGIQDVGKFRCALACEQETHGPGGLRIEHAEIDALAEMRDPLRELGAGTVGPWKRREVG